MSENKSQADQMWHDWFMTDAFKVEKQQRRFLRLLPHDPRCKLCHSPFHGNGGVVVGALFGRRKIIRHIFVNCCSDENGKFQEYSGGFDAGSRY